MGGVTQRDLHVNIVLSYGLEELLHGHFVRFALSLTPRQYEGGAVEKGGYK